MFNPIKKTFLFLFSVPFLLYALTSIASAQGPAPDTASVFNSQYNFLANIRPSDYVTTAINIFLGLAGVAAFIYLLWGGVQWVTSGGDKDAIEKSRKRIMHALIGLAIVFSAYALILIIQILFGISTIWLPLRPIGVNLPPMPTYAPPPTRAPTGIVPTIPGGSSPTPTNSPTATNCVGNGGTSWPVGTCSAAPAGGCYDNTSASFCVCSAPGTACNTLSYSVWCSTASCVPSASPTPAVNCAQTFNCRGTNINVACNNWCLTCSAGASGGSCTGNGGLCVCSATP